MAKFIKLHREWHHNDVVTQPPIYVNVDHIVDIYTWDDYGTCIDYAGGEDGSIVGIAETPEEILEMIGERVDI